MAERHGGAYLQRHLASNASSDVKMLLSYDLEIQSEKRLRSYYSYKRNAMTLWCVSKP
jgi:hypothetical protein